MLKFKASIAERWRSGMRRMIYLAVILLLIITTAYAKESDQDQTTFNDFTLNIGDRIDIGDYRAWPMAFRLAAVKESASSHVARTNRSPSRTSGWRSLSGWFTNSPASQPLMQSRPLDMGCRGEGDAPITRPSSTCRMRPQPQPQ